MSGVLVIGIGNPDRGDDGVGPRVADALRGRLASGTVVRTRPGDMLALIDDWAEADAVIGIDACAPMGAPGTIRRIDAVHEPLPPGPSLASSHAFGLAEAIALSRTLGTLPRQLVVVAIEGRSFDVGAPLTPEVAAAIPAAVALVSDEAKRLAARVAVDA